MGQSKQTFTMTWRGCEVDVAYCPCYSQAMEDIQGYALAHLEIESVGRTPLPFTDTGYQSHFLPAFEVESEGGPLAYVRHWLDWAARDPSWQGVQLALL